MFALVLVWGIFSYLVLGMGWVSKLTPVSVTITLGVFLAVSGFICLKGRENIFRLRQRAILIQREFKLVRYMGLILGVFAIINLVGALGPELGFDALWYHLTIPRIWLLEGKVFNIPGGYFYYSLVPKSLDIIYLSLLPIFSYLGPKILHWGLGLAATAITYKIARKWLSPVWSVLAALIFYSNLVVAWQSITAYVDLGRTFLETLVFYYFINRQNYKSAIILGLAISTKFLAIGSLPIFLILWLWQKESIPSIFRYLLIVLLIPSPWWIWSYLQTGNPFYPIFSGYDLSSVRHLWDVITIWVRSPDPLTPVYFIVFPLWFIFRKRIPVAITIYCLLSLMIWWIIPRTGGGRFLLPYLPAFSVLASYLIFLVKQKYVQQILLGAVLIITFLNMTWRFGANYKYLPVILHQQSETDFLNKNLNYFGHNFYYLPDDQLKKLYE